ncbi:hypothetical protein DVH26_15510 [Paenibacillus sp. H1-7]|nr:hypothetical protein DVH26_15510 [Paenibacillus sp. H1-7]
MGSIGEKNMSKGSGMGKLFITAGLVILLGVFISEQGFAANVFSWNTKTVDIEKTVKAEGIRSVNIDGGRTDVKVVRGHSEAIEIRLDGRVKRDAADNIQLQADPRRDTLELKVEIPERFPFGMSFSDLNLTVELPEQVWENVKVQTVSGDVDIEELKGTNIDVHANSGDVTANDIEAGQVTLQAGSGNIESNAFRAKNLTFHVGSGDVSLSGGQAIIKGETSSGNIDVAVNELDQDMDLKAGSGDVTVKTANEPKSLTVQYNGGSGSGNIEWDNVTYKEKGEDGRTLKGVFGSGTTQLKVRTGSGNFTLGQD